MDPTIVNAKPRFRPPTLVDPPGFGYLLLAAEVEPPDGPRPFPGSSEAKTALLGPVPPPQRSAATGIEAAGRRS